MSYRKRIGLDNLKKGELTQLRRVCRLIGYTENEDFRINYFNESKEMIILNKEMHRDMRTIRKTTYSKGK